MKWKNFMSDIEIKNIIIICRREVFAEYIMYFIIEIKYGEVKERFGTWETAFVMNGNLPNRLAK